jgi:RNA polymerase sigma-70 factor (ECF subfamily)
MLQPLPSPRSSATPAGRADAGAAALPAGLASAVAALAADTALSDAELVRRSLAGQQDPFAALVARYQKRAFWIAFHVIGRTEDARVVTQEAFVRLHRSLASYDFSRSFYTWFYRIVMNLAIDCLRKLRSTRAGNLDELLSGLPDLRAAAGDVPLQRQEQHGQVWAILDRLDAKFRSVLVLRDIHGLSCREIAPILRVTHATARWRLHRGRQLFRDHWERLEQGGRP